MPFLPPGRGEGDTEDPHCGVSPSLGQTTWLGSLQTRVTLAGFLLPAVWKADRDILQVPQTCGAMGGEAKAASKGKHQSLCSLAPLLQRQEVAASWLVPSFSAPSELGTHRWQEAHTKYFDEGHLGAAEIKSFLAQRPVQSDHQCVSPPLPAASTVPVLHCPPAKEALSSEPQFPALWMEQGLWEAVQAGLGLL